MKKIQNMTPQEIGDGREETGAKKSKASPEARAIIGAFSSPEDAALMDEVMELVHSDKERQNARLEQLGQDIDLGIEQIENGQYTQVSAENLPDFVTSIKAEGRKRRAQGYAPNSRPLK